VTSGGKDVHTMRTRHLTISPGFAELKISKGDILFGRRALYRIGGAKLPDEPNVEQSNGIIKAIFNPEGRDGPPLVSSGFGSKGSQMSKGSQV
jgi:hypothetical protein